VAKNIFDFNSFGRELNKEGYYEEDLKIIVEMSMVNRRKWMLFLNLLKMNWNEYKGILTEKGVKKSI
jgi:hypothetical protein